VYPVNQLPAMTKGRVAIINVESTEQDETFDVVIHGKAGAVLSQLNEILGCTHSGGCFKRD
jgi:NAD-dependent deacetylase